MAQSYKICLSQSTTEEEIPNRTECKWEHLENNFLITSTAFKPYIGKKLDLIAPHWTLLDPTARNDNKFYDMYVSMLAMCIKQKKSLELIRKAL